MPRSPRRTAPLAVAAILASGVLAGCSRSSGSTEAFCTQVEKVPALEAVLARFSEADPDVLSDRIAKARTAYDALADAAPDEIADETDQVVSLVDDILTAVEQHPTDPAKASAQLRAAMAQHKGVEADRAKVTAYAKEQCGVQLDATLGDGVGSTATSSSTTAPTGSTTTGG